ncbi:MAG TPA: hypothetical protein VD996_13890 [Chitinophagaceae bacterium]|nr:hypothetical protein [Chitinophagaceae bacterium]
MQARLPLLCAVLLLCSQVWCQSPAVQWSRFYGNAAGSIAIKTIETPDGGYLMAGHAYFDGGMVSGHHGGIDIWLVKLDANGGLQWQRCLGGTADEHLAGEGLGGDLIATSDGGYILVGQSESVNGDVTATIEGNHGLFDAWVVKLAADGAIQWQRSLGGSSDERDYCIKQTSDGGYILAGHTMSNDQNVAGNHGGTDIWVVKLNASGTIIEWQRCLGSTASEWYPHLEFAHDGAYIIAAGTYGNNGDVSGNHEATEADVWVVKLTTTGDIQWQKCYGGTSTDIGTGIKATPDGGYVVAGYTFSDDGDLSEPADFYDMWVFKINGTGELQWEETFGSWNMEFANSIALTNTNKIVVSGITESHFDDGDVVGAKGERDMWTICLSSTGELLWQKTLGGSLFDQAMHVMQTTDGGFLISGESASNDFDAAGNPFPFAAWVVKLAPESTLPVDLVNFSGKHDAGINKLRWTTAFERNNASFILERSADGRSFQPVATIAGKGESNVPVDYAYTDNKDILQYDELFYRLKQVDVDGTATYSRIISIQRPYSLTQISGWQQRPGMFTLEVKAEKDLGMSILVHDASGKLLEQKRQRVAAGRTRMDISLGRYPAGAYFIEVISENSRKTFRAVN